MVTVRKATTAGKKAQRHEALGLAADDLLAIYQKMALTRALSGRLWQLNRMGKAYFVIASDGHEAAQVGSAYALRPGRDFVLPYYRDLGVVLTVGMTPEEVLLSVLARAADPSSGGRQMSAHYSHPRLRIIPASAPVATQIPQAVGVALATKLRGEEDVTIVYFGDGATSKGDFHEGLNFAGVYRPPLVFFCENNQYAISVPLHKQMGIENVSQRAAAYGFPGVTVDGNDVLAVYEASKEAVERARRGGGPTLIEAVTYRYFPHSSEDDDRRYRPREEVEAWRQRDPIQGCKAYLLEAGVLTEEADQEISARVAAEVDRATEAAEASPLPRPEEALGHLYHEG